MDQDDGDALGPAVTRSRGALTTAATVGWIDFREGTNGDPYVRRTGR
jgi:hypothetical protein